MAVTFTLKADLADFGVHDRAGIKVRITAEPEIKKDSGRIHSDRPEDVTTDPDGKCSKELLSAPGLWYRVTTPYVRAINPVRFAAYIPDPLDPTTGVAFAPDTVIDLFDLMDENPSPGYDAMTLVPVELFAQVTEDALTATDQAGIATAAATSASGSASAADAAKVAAAASQSAAAGSASAASGSASTATTQAGTATTQAGIATTKAAESGAYVAGVAGIISASVVTEISTPGTPGRVALTAAAGAAYDAGSATLVTGASAFRTAADARWLRKEPINTDPTIALAITDTEGRRSWLEVADDGAAPARVKTLINSWVLAARPTTPLVSDVAFAVVDSADRISEIAVNEQGRVPQWVLDRWAARMSIPLPVIPAPTIVTPSVRYALVGTAHQSIHQHSISGLSADHKVKVTNPAGGTTSLGDRWAITPVASTTTAVTVQVFDRTLTEVASTAVSVITNDATLSTPCRLLPIGDSITRTGTYATTAAALVGGTTVGTREVSGAITEGRGGWRLSSYTNNIGTSGASVTDSPFIFPVGVAPASFRGNTEWWKLVVSGPGTADYGAAGFQRIARPGFATSGAFLFDATGYPVTPAEGDVVVDPTRSAGATWRVYASGAWTTMSPQPATELNFSSYMIRYAAAFAGGAPTVISILLGTNDFYAAYDATAFTAYAASMDALIASIRVWSATVPIILCIPPVGGYQADWATAGVHEWEYQARMKSFAAAMIAKYDTPAMRTAKVLLVSFLSAVDDADFGASNTVHPDTPGHVSMAPWLAGAIASALN